jgi:hypothetical protein
MGVLEAYFARVVLRLEAREERGVRTVNDGV